MGDELSSFFFFSEGWAIPRKELIKKAIIGKGEFGGKLSILWVLQDEEFLIANEKKNCKYSFGTVICTFTKSAIKIIN